MISHKSTLFTESVIRGMTQLCNKYNAINLSQGTPGFEPPEEVKQAAMDAIRDGFNQYSITWGAPKLRQAIARKMTEFNSIPTDPDQNVTVTCGATEGMMAAMLAIINPGGTSKSCFKNSIQILLYNASCFGHIDFKHWSQNID